MLESILIFIFILAGAFIIWDFYDDKNREKELKEIAEFWEKKRLAYDDKLGKAKKYINERNK